MGIFNRITGGGVDWQIEFNTPAPTFRPGDEIAGKVHYAAKANMQARAIKVALVGREEYVYDVRESRATFGSSSNEDRWERQWFNAEAYRQEAGVAGATDLTAGTPAEFSFAFRVPADAPPSFDSPVLRLRWLIRAWLDVGGVDPNTERDVYVLSPQGGGQGQSMGVPWQPPAVPASGAITLQPLPLVAGQPFQGYVDVNEQLDPRNTRVEIKQRVETRGASGAGIGLTINNVSMGGQRTVSDERVLWSGQIAAAGAGPAGQRYTFSGQLPLSPIGDVNLPHGSSSSYADIVISRRLFPDRHITQPVSVVIG